MGRKGIETVRLGKTEMMVSKLGFRGIPIQRVPEDEAVAGVRRKYQEQAVVR